jgi:hypothetical protein
MVHLLYVAMVVNRLPSRQQHRQARSHGESFVHPLTLGSSAHLAVFHEHGHQWENLAVSAKARQAETGSSLPTGQDGRFSKGLSSAKPGKFPVLLGGDEEYNHVRMGSIFCERKKFCDENCSCIRLT